METLYIIFAISIIALIVFRYTNKLEIVLFGIYFLFMIISFIGFLVQGRYYFSLITGVIIAITIFRMRQSYKRFER